MKHKNLATTLVVALVMLLLVGIPLVSAGSGPGEPENGKPVNWQTLTFYPATQLTTTATNYSANPRTSGGTDITRIPQWSVAEVFVTADVSGTARITVTPQLSNDAVNWTDAAYPYLSNSSTTSTSVVTGTNGLTATTTTVGATSTAAGNYQIALSADGTSYQRVPIAGEYLRFKIDSSATSSQTVTATVKVTLKNYQ